MRKYDRRLDARGECRILDDAERSRYNPVLLWTVGVRELLLDAKLFPHLSKLTTIELPAVVRSYHRYVRGYSIGARVGQKLRKSVP